MLSLICRRTDVLLGYGDEAFRGPLYEVTPWNAAAITLSTVARHVACRWLICVWEVVSVVLIVAAARSCARLCVVKESCAANAAIC